jgi:hypothetical protein
LVKEIVGMSDKTYMFDLNKDRLDEEWLSQSRLYYENAVKLTEARADYDAAKADREVIAAELSQDIRKGPSHYGLEKVTEASVTDVILLQQSHKDAVKVEIDKRREVGLLQAMVDALDHRKKALENLVQLDGRNYWMNSLRIPDDNNGVVRDRIERAERQAAFGKGKKRRE